MLTGESRRIAEGARLLSEGRAERMKIDEADLPRLLAGLRPDGSPLGLDGHVAMAQSLRERGWLLPAYISWYTLVPRQAGGRLFSDPMARASFLLFANPHRFPHAFRQSLTIVPPAVLAAIVIFSAASMSLSMSTNVQPSRSASSASAFPRSNGVCAPAGVSSVPPVPK